jgi:crotonobetaine/carnitine-CoA ligase
MSFINNQLILANLISEKCTTNPHLDALTFVNITNEETFSEEVRTYQELWDNAQHIACALLEEGMSAGQRFGLLMQNHPEFVDAMVGASITNTVYVPIDARTKGEKLCYMIDFAECKGVVVADYALDNLLEVISELPKLEWVWVLDSGQKHELAAASKQIKSLRKLSDIYQGTIPTIEVMATNPDDPMQLLYTSGTTGDPKAIIAPHSRFGGNATMGSLFGFQAGDRPYTGLSLTHANAQMITMGMGLYMELRTVISRKFTKKHFWDITRYYGCTSFNLLGGMTTAIYSEASRPNDRDNPIRFVLSAGMPKNIWADFSKRFDIDIFEFYGAAEGGITINSPNSGPIGSIGKPLPIMEARILDENEHQCPPNQPGEICFRTIEGNPIAVKYFKNAKASEEKTAGGWLRMGDVGYVDENGWYYFLHRKGGGIRRNGEFIDAAEIEKVLSQHDAIDDVFVYGVDAESGAIGEKDIIAAVVVNKGAAIVKNKTAITHISKDLFKLCRDKLESNSVPSFLQFVDEIPKTASEKPQERFLLESFKKNDEVIKQQ